MSINNGKRLEKIVKEFETVAAKQNWKIETNQKKYLEDGVQLAEFDIIISYSENDRLIRWLIECRDRPSQGRSPGAWIEQLVGRKHLNKFNKVTAVSTTGFSPAAIHYAEQSDIELRTVEELLSPELWSSEAKLTTYSRTGSFLRIQLVLPSGTSNELKKLLKENLPQNSGNLPLYFDSHSDPVNSIDIFQNICLNEKTGIYDGLKAGESKDVSIYYQYSEKKQQNAMLIFDNKSIPLTLHLQPNSTNRSRDIHLKLNEKYIKLKAVLFSGKARIDKFDDKFSSIHAMKKRGKGLISQKIVTDSECKNFNGITLYETVQKDNSRILMIKSNNGTSISLETKEIRNKA
ncbi:MAG: hypothetical protein D3905_02490 [Candidatus Electrothrix sp. AS4_5]|nr:hypothetical protein [Candidatus Electrothrix gigas]MCI5188669.1 hypothetical protein [Candidatus Electrothrix gigas]